MAGFRFRLIRMVKGRRLIAHRLKKLRILPQRHLRAADPESWQSPLLSLLINKRTRRNSDHLFPACRSDFLDRIPRQRTQSRHHHQHHPSGDPHPPGNGPLPRVLKSLRMFFLNPVLNAVLSQRVTHPRHLLVKTAPILAYVCKRLK